MNTQDLLIRLGISLGLGLLVGLQRERKKEELAGIRTFALIAVLGTIFAIMGQQVNSAWPVPVGGVALAVLLGVGALNKARLHQEAIGLTTEIAALVMYALGAYLGAGDQIVALVLGGAVVWLLYWKNVLHGFVKKLGDADFAAIMQFVLIAGVILPVLPRERFGPYGFFNPFETWLVVVLVVSMSLGGYVLYKFVPPTAGALLGGAVGGDLFDRDDGVLCEAIAERSGDGADGGTGDHDGQYCFCLPGDCAALDFARDLALPLIEPLGVLAGIMAVLTAVSFWLGRHAHAALPTHGNPTELKAALLFAAMYTAVKLATAWGKALFGAAALYVVAGISGLTDVAAITLSMSESVHNATVPASVAWRVIAVAVLANLVFKGGSVMVLGSARLKKWVAGLFGAGLVLGVGLILLWPW